MHGKSDLLCHQKVSKKAKNYCKILTQAFVFREPPFTASLIATRAIKARDSLKLENYRNDPLGIYFHIVGIISVEGRGASECVLLALHHMLTPKVTDEQKCQRKGATFTSRL